jgi:ABC-type branched-subunit amino acid transport system ATPase component
MDICQLMTDIWLLIQIMFEQHDLVQRARQAIDRIKGELGEMSTEANEIIKFLNSKSKEELEALQIEDRTETILEVKRVLTKRGLMLQLEEKFQAMDVAVQRFFSKTDSLQKKGLPSLFVINNKLITFSDYKQKILTVAKDGSKFAGIKGNITGKAFLETLRLDPSIQQEIKYLFITKPTFTKYTEMDEVYRRLLKVNIPSQQRWDDLCDLIN